MEMKRYKLGEIAYFVEEKISSDELTLNEYITTDCLLQNKKGRTIATNLPPKSCSLTKFKKGDVLIGNIRPYLKKIWFAESAGGCSLDVLVLRAKKMEEASFLYSLLLQDDFFDFVMKAPKGSKMPRGDKNHILTYPCFDIQNKIEVGSFIKSLDGKIVLNKRINARLEAMAKRLYDYWFVQFDYPDKNGKPYKTSGGKMVWNEVLKREIPEGWEVVEMSSVIKQINTGLNPRDNFILGNGKIKYVTVKNLTEEGHIDFSNCDLVNSEAQKIIHERSQIQTGDILFASICPLGRCYLIQDSPEEWDINESVFSIRPNIDRITSEFLYTLLRESYYVKKMTQKATGSIFKGIRINDIEKIEILLPPKDIINAFSKKTLPIFNYQLTIQKEIQKLTDLRDRLLPLLMNGQVEVGTNNSSEFCNAKLGKQATACNMNGQVEVEG